MFIGKYGEIDDFGEYAKIKKTNENKTFHKSFKVFLVFTLMLVLLSVSSSVSAHDINQDDSILNCADTCDVAYADVCGGGYVDVCDVACADDLDDSVLSQDDSVLSQDVSVLSYDDSVLSKDDFNQAVLSSEDENTIYLDYENGLDSNNGNSSSPVKTLEKAYELVPNGGMISLAEGTVFKNSLNDIVIMKNISIKGVFNKSIINANQNRVFFIPNNYSLSLDSVVIENAYTDENGGAICNEGTLIVNNSVFRNNTSKVHGGF